MILIINYSCSCMIYLILYQNKVLGLLFTVQLRHFFLQKTDFRLNIF